MNQKIEERIDKIIADMSLRDKIGQLTQAVFHVADPEGTKKLIKEMHPGSLIVATSAWAGNDLQESAQQDVMNDVQRFAMEEMGIPIIYGRDVIHGHKVVYPVPLAMSAAFNPDLVRRAYRATALEATNEGIHWSFTPMLDVSRDPRWGRIIEGPGEDPYLGECFARAAVEGLQGDDLTKQDGMVACAKHYVGYGQSEGGRDYHRTEISDYTLRNYYLKAFRAAVKAGCKTVMSSFNDISGQPTTSSHYLLTEVLKEEFGFDGYVVSDWDAVVQLKNQGVAEDGKDCARLAINAGLDMDMCDHQYYNYLEELVKEGEVSMDTVDEAVRRVLRVKMEAGLFENPYTEAKPVDTEAHLALAREFAQESIVLLKNNGILPLKKDVRVAICGPMTKERRALLGSWSLDFDLGQVPTLEEAMKNAIGADKVEGVGLWDEMGSAIRRSDITVLALGESNLVTGESRNLVRVELTDAQKELARIAHDLGHPVIGVMFFGRPIALQDVEHYFDAIVYAWHGGSQVAPAVCDILFGDVNPSGKTAMTFVRATGQIPLYYNVSPSGRKVMGYYGETDIFNRNYEDCLGTPMYPFGYGLSYTTFAYSDLTTNRTSISLSELENGETVKISVNVKNTGDRAGKEVAQCYVRDCISELTRPMKELKGFAKPSIEAGETKTVTFELGKEAFAYYNVKSEYVVEPGKFVITVGTNCLCTDAIEIFVEK